MSTFMEKHDVLNDNVDYFVKMFDKAYRVINSCETPEQLDSARSYIGIVEQRMALPLLPICQVLHTILASRSGEIQQRA